jgi:hypothetical protein
MGHDGRISSVKTLWLLGPEMLVQERWEEKLEIEERGVREKQEKKPSVKEAVCGAWK